MCMNIPLIGKKDSLLSPREKMDAYFRHSISEHWNEITAIKGMMSGQMQHMAAITRLVCEKLKITPKEMAESMLDEFANNTFFMSINAEIDNWEKREKEKAEELAKLNPEKN